MLHLRQYVVRTFTLRNALRTITSGPEHRSNPSSKEIRNEFYYNSNQKFINQIINLDDSYTDVKFIEPWIRKILEYNDVSQAKTTGVLLNAYRYLEKPENMTEKNFELAHKLAHCIDFFIYYYLVADDIVDNSKTRLQAPCWYKLPEVGFGVAIYDSMLIRDMVFKALKQFFGDKPYYNDIIELFNGTMLSTSIGIKLELAHKKPDGIDYKYFTSKFYALQCKYKTSDIVYLLPIRLCMFMCGIKDPLLHEAIKDVCIKLGIYLQAQDDFLDLDARTFPTGEIGNDIEEGKNSWPASTAMEHCNDKQLEIMKNYYGSKDKENVQRIIDLYKELNMVKLFSEFEESMYKAICHDINILPEELPSDLFYNLVHKIYKGRRQLY